MGRGGEWGGEEREDGGREGRRGGGESGADREEREGGEGREERRGEEEGREGEERRGEERRGEEGGREERGGEERRGEEGGREERGGEERRGEEGGREERGGEGNEGEGWGVRKGGRVERKEGGGGGMEKEREHAGSYHMYILNIVHTFVDVSLRLLTLVEVMLSLFTDAPRLMLWPMVTSSFNSVYTNNHLALTVLGSGASPPPLSPLPATLRSEGPSLPDTPAEPPTLLSLQLGSPETQLPLWTEAQKPGK